MKRKTCFLIAGIGMLLLTNCARKPVTEAGPIRYEIDRQPYRIVNHSPDRIEVLHPAQLYVRGKEGWNHALWLARFGLSDEFFAVGKFVDSGNEWEDDEFLKPETCAVDSNCDIFASRRYRVPGLPGRVFVVYSNEGRPSDPAQMQEGTLSLSMSPSDPFHFTLHNASDEEARLCWTRANKNRQMGWAEDSRLERQTEYGTWEIISHTLDLCAGDVDAGIKIPVGKTVDIDGTRAYPDYAQLPPGVYRWVIAPSQAVYYHTSLFSPRFRLGDQKQ